jgi:hypothetical protein
MKAASQERNIADTIIKQIQTADRFAMGAWGTRELVSLDETPERLGGLMFRVSGSKLRGKVRVELSHQDTYTVTSYRFRNHSAHLVSEATGVYCDQLMGIVDGMVEKGRHSAAIKNL